jgi:hypothetical protein
MSADDLKINSRVRKILVEKNLNLSFVNVSTRSGAVSIRGEIKKLSGSQMSDGQTAKFLRHVEETILHIKEVKRVTFSLHGWEKRRGKWKRTSD